VQFEFERDRDRMRCALVATPGEYDGLPLLTHVDVSALPLTVHPDRAAIAAALLFRSSVAGAFAMPPGCSPVVASAIRAWFAPVDVQVMSVEFKPSRITGGDATLHVLAEGINDGAVTRTSENDVIVRVLREGAGFVATRRELSLVSNGALLAGRALDPLERALPAVAVALLFAEDLFAHRIALPGIGAGSLQERLRALLDAAALALAEPLEAAA
jgi:hypothetical protein